MPVGRGSVSILCAEKREDNSGMDFVLLSFSLLRLVGFSLSVQAWWPSFSRQLLVDILLFLGKFFVIGPWEHSGRHRSLAKEQRDHNGENFGSFCLMKKRKKTKQKQKTQTQTKMEKDKADETWYKNATDEDYIEKENGR